MTTATLPAPPRAEQRPYSFERHGVRVEDHYAWLRDKGYPKVDDTDVLDYLKAENAYFDAAMKPHAALVETLFQEMKGRIKEDDSSVPLRDGDYLYWSAFKPGTQYRFWYRKPVAGGPDQLLLDENAEAAGKEYFRLGAFAVSPDGKRLATLVDDDGSERFKLVVRDLATGKPVETVTTVGIGSPVWTKRFEGPRLHRGQRPVAQLSRALPRHRPPARRDEDALRGKGRHRFLGRGRAAPPTTA